MDLHFPLTIGQPNRSAAQTTILPPTPKGQLQLDHPHPLALALRASSSCYFDALLVNMFTPSRPAPPPPPSPPTASANDFGADLPPNHPFARYIPRPASCDSLNSYYWDDEPRNQCRSNAFLHQRHLRYGHSLPPSPESVSSRSTTSSPRDTHHRQYSHHQHYRN